MADDFDDIPERNYAEEEEAHFYFTIKEFEPVVLILSPDVVWCLLPVPILLHPQIVVAE